MLANSRLFTANTTDLNSGSYERFAIYYIPTPGSDLAEFGRVWFGQNDNEADENTRLFGLETERVQQITKTPARYGMHATLKAPFYLAEGYQLNNLLKTAESFAQNRKSFSIGKLKPTWFSNILVLTPETESRNINQFASQCVLGFEDFRAPLTMKERTRRLEQNLNLHQRVMLEEWGYPYVLSEFKFHITITGKLSREQKEQVLPKLIPALDHICKTPCTIDAIAVAGDPGQGKPFEIIERFELGKGE